MQELFNENNKNAAKKNERRSEEIEIYTMFLYWKIQYYLGNNSFQIDLKHYNGLAFLQYVLCHQSDLSKDYSLIMEFIHLKKYFMAQGL